MQFEIRSSVNVAKLKKVITYGTFDVLHPGHINLLRKAKSLGDYLIVGIAGDTFNLGKGKKSCLDFSYRKEVLEAIRYVDFTFEETSWDQKIKDVKKYNADVFVIGDDWKGKFDFLLDYCEVIYLPRTPNISTTELKSKFD